MSIQIRKTAGVLPKLFFNCIGRLRDRLLPQAPSVPILFYHQVAEGSLVIRNQRSCMSPRKFEEQMRFLRNHGYKTLSMAELLDWLEGKIEIPSKSVCVTFDDGHRDNYTNAFPILQKYGITATIFVCPFQVGREMWYSRKRKRWERAFDDKDDLYFEFLSWDQIREMAAGGVHFESHSLTHPFLITLEIADLVEEVRESKAILEEELGQTVEFFSYPYGDYNQTVRQAVIGAGYRAAVATERKLVHAGDDPFALGRLWVIPEYDPACYEIMLHGLDDLYERVISSLIPEGLRRRSVLSGGDNG